MGRILEGVSIALRAIWGSKLRSFMSVLGNIVAATDADGVERGRRRFVMVDGEDAHSGCVDRYGFTGQEEFASLGLVRFQHRWLDTVTRRWARPDPAFAAVPSLGLSRAGEIADPFGYVGNQ